MDRDCLDRVDADRSLDFAEAVQLELIDLIQSVRILPVVLNKVDVVGHCEQAGESGCL